MSLWCIDVLFNNKECFLIPSAFFVSSEWLLFVYMEDTDFWAFMLYPVNLLNLLKVVLVVIFQGFLGKLLYHMQVNVIVLLFQVLCFWFVCLIWIQYMVQFSSVQSINHVRLIATPWIAAHQASLSITNSQSSLKLMSIELVMPSSHLILWRPLLLLPPYMVNCSKSHDHLFLFLILVKCLKVVPH